MAIKTHSSHRALVLCVIHILFTLSLSLTLSAQDAQIDPYYMRMFEKGQLSFKARDYLEATQDLELALFGIRNRIVRAKGAVYLCICHYYLSDNEACERYFLQAEEYLQDQSLDSLDLDWSEIMAFSEIWNHFHPSVVFAVPNSLDDPSDPPDAEVLQQKRIDLEQRIKDEPSDFPAYYELFETYMFLKDSKNAKKTLERLIKKNAQEIRAYYEIGRIAYEAGEFEAALDIFKELFLYNRRNLGPKDIILKSRALLILCYLHTGDKISATRLASRVVQDFPLEVIASLGLKWSDKVTLRAFIRKNLKMGYPI